MRVVAILLIPALLAGCRRNNPEEAAVSSASPPPAAALAREHRSLDDGLGQLDRLLSLAMRGDLEGDEAEGYLMRAEAITDRLLETDLPFHWMRARDYSVESAVRQIQALADRVIARMRNGMDGQQILADVRDLRRQVIELRRGLAAGGGEAPLSLDSLLARYANDTTVVTDVGE
ncbi:MAG TPA: hypothetical protein VFZ04_06755 [Longimicrobiales bacterium]